MQPYLARPFVESSYIPDLKSKDKTFNFKEGCKQQITHHTFVGIHTNKLFQEIKNFLISICLNIILLQSPVKLTQFSAVVAILVLPQVLHFVWLIDIHYFNTFCYARYVCILKSLQKASSINTVSLWSKWFYESFGDLVLIKTCLLCIKSISGNSGAF